MKIDENVETRGRFSKGIAVIKKSVIFAAALVAGFATAQVAAAQTSPFNGFYAGGQVWYSYIDVEVSVDDFDLLDENMDSFGGGAFIGFGWVNNQMYGGLEAEVGYDGADWSENVLGTTFDAEAKLTFGLSARVGGVIADKYLIYGRVGWVRTNAELSISGFGSDDEYFDGFRFGGGVETILWDNFSARVEYTYTIYEDIWDIPGVDFDVDQHLVRIGVAYYF